MRAKQGKTTSDDYFDSDLLEALQSDKQIYRNPKLALGWTGNKPPDWITANEYLDYKLSTDGDWGIMLAQTNDDAGLKRIVEGPEEERSPDAMTKNGTEHFMVAGNAVDAMGLFEWLALTFQEDPSTLSSRDVSWLLANRIPNDNGARVPGGDFIGGQVGSDLGDAGDADDGARVRLAVM